MSLNKSVQIELNELKITVISFKHSILAAISLVVSTQSLYAANPQVIYSRGNVFFTSSTNGFYAPFGGEGSAYIFYGSFSDIASITTSSTAQEIEDDFSQLGLSSADVYDIDATFAADSLDTTFAGKRGYIVAANNADIGLATEIAVVSNSSTDPLGWLFNSTITGNDEPYTISSNEYAPTDPNVDLVLGSFAADDASGNRYIQLSVVAVVPEPSSFALLGLGTCLLIFRRKK